ncbi:MAG: tetratricopeptide repeat protein [Planctomycetota bacterium]|jgi:hypothetical protein
MRTATVLFLLAVCASLSADTITTEDRGRLEGRVVRENDKTLVIETYRDGPIEIRKDRITKRKEGKSKLDQYDEKKKEAEETAQGLYELAAWCRKTGLLYRAELEYEAALKLDPEHEKAKRELKRLQERLLRERTKGTEKVKLKVVIKVDADAAWLEEFKGVMQKAVEAWWECTNGQMIYDEIHIEDKKSEGDVVITNLDKVKMSDEKYGFCSPSDKRIWLGGKFHIVTFVHEMGHREFRLPEGYGDGSKNKHDGCVMNPYNAREYRFCDKKSYNGKETDCWTRIRKIKPKWKHPNGYARCPSVKITVKNN